MNYTNFINHACVPKRTLACRHEINEKKSPLEMVCVPISRCFLIHFLYDVLYNVFIVIIIVFIFVFFVKFVVIFVLWLFFSFYSLLIISAFFAVKSINLITHELKNSRPIIACPSEIPPSLVGI